MRTFAVLILLPALALAQSEEPSGPGITLGNVGTSSNSTGMSLDPQGVLSLQPASLTQPGVVVPTTAQNFGSGDKTFRGKIISTIDQPNDAIQMVNNTRLHLGNGSIDYLYSDGFNVHFPGALVSDVTSGGTIMGATIGARMTWTGGPGYLTGDGSGLVWGGIVAPAADNSQAIGSASKRVSEAFIQTFRDSASNARLSLNSSNSTNTYKSFIADGSSAVGHTFDTSVDIVNATGRLASFRGAATERFGISGLGKMIFNYTDSSASPGAATINKPHGRSAVASAASSVVVTNSLMTTTTGVIVSRRTPDATCVQLTWDYSSSPVGFTVSCASAAGVSATATAAVEFEWLIVGL